MKVGIPREVKNHEYRVAITPAGRATSSSAPGTRSSSRRAPGVGSSIPDDDFVAAGREILAAADDVWADGDLVLKVKEPIAEEYHRMRAGQVLFTYLHLAASRECTDALLDSGRSPASPTRPCSRPTASLPLLAPMSEVAGRLAPQVGAHHLMRARRRPRRADGRRLRRVRGQGRRHRRRRLRHERRRDRARHAGRGPAAGHATSTGCAQADAIYQGHLQTVASNAYEIERAVLDADLVIGAVLVPGRQGADAGHQRAGRPG